MFELYEDANRPFEVHISPKEDLNFFEDMLSEGCAMHKIKFPDDAADKEYRYSYVLVESNGDGYNFTYISRKAAKFLTGN